MNPNATTTKPGCDLCGAPAIVHIRPDASDAETVYHFCLACADAEPWLQSGPTAFDRRMSRAALLLVSGLVILVLSLGADFFAFGRAEGFGWKQMTGALCGLAALLLGALSRVQTLVLVGLITAGLTLLADRLHFGSSPGFGRHQILGTLVGIALIWIGTRIARRKTCNLHERP